MAKQEEMGGLLKTQWENHRAQRNRSVKKQGGAALPVV